MNKLYMLCIVLLTIQFYSCEKTTDSIDDEAIRTLTIDNTMHTFINDNGTRYVENTLVSQQDQHVYKLAMTKGIQYRISTTQPGALNVQTKLTLVNSKRDTLSESLNESPAKSLIVLTSPETADYYLIVNLQKRTNPAFTYRLFFEEIKDDPIKFSGLNWSTNGSWSVSNPNTLVLSNTGCYVYRHIRLVDPVAGNPGISFVVQSNSANGTNIGFVMSSSTEYIGFGEWAYELTNSGYAFMAFRDNMRYTVLTMTKGAMSLDWSNAGAINLDFISGVKVEIKYQSGYYVVYLNNVQLRSINGTLQNFNILVEDCGDGETMIRDLQMIN